MKLSEIINNLDKSRKNTEAPQWDKISSQFSNINPISWSGDTRLKCYWVAKHLCTDTQVGILAYFLDDEFICISHQTSRKSSVFFK